jgi:hypothetical protein
MLQASTAVASTTSQYSQSNSITSQQSEKLTTYLADYDSTQLTESDAKKIVSQIQELGIRPGSGLESVLSENGIDAKGLAEQAGIKGGDDAGRPPPPPPGGGQGGGGGAQAAESVDESIVSLIADAVDAFAETEDAESTWSLLQPALEEAGYDTSQQLFDLYL